MPRRRPPYSVRAVQVFAAQFWIVLGVLVLLGLVLRWAGIV